MQTVEQQIELLNQQISAHVNWLQRTTKTVWKLIAILVTLIIIANILNWYA